MRKCFLIWSVVTAGLSTFSFTSDVITDTYIGYAYQEGTENLLYTEHFTDTFIKGIHVTTQTTYYTPDNKLIVSRTLNFNCSLTAPDFETKDLRTGYIEGATVVGKTVKLFVRKNKNSVTTEKLIYVPEPIVIDGGFNQYIKSQWNALQRGKAVIFNFVVPCRLDYFALRARKISSDLTTTTIRVEPENIMVRWLVIPITIQYDLSTKRILSYEGKSNISDEKGVNFMARLVYPEKGP